MLSGLLGVEGEGEEIVATGGMGMVVVVVGVAVITAEVGVHPHGIIILVPGTCQELALLWLSCCECRYYFWHIYRVLYSPNFYTNHLSSHNESAGSLNQPEPAYIPSFTHLLM